MINKDKCIWKISSHYDTLFRRFHLKEDESAKNKEFLNKKAFDEKLRKENKLKT